ncbi:uncharacterized protein BDZ99DRAFT_476318 [Mytilinidion resinicola]|uniref:Uncharacterized protein n=1 Tax=Mytilinidion resinicola TaxID=574789 RepID=A0A6A6YMZ4_9PEZI|nr:uncharacterized protein BDZ99DRAFT_476318 [Mytilinidion resinicola]KAF2810111.1 hypothetical protein BDZ99DRAFT_476318 [Mytilinidion resinicola]
MGQLLSTPLPTPGSQAPQAIPTTPTKFPASPASSSAGDRESHVRIGELCRHVKDLEDRLEAAAKEHATIQNWLLAQLVAQNGVKSAAIPDVSARDSNLDACLKRIGELEKEVEASRKAQQARPNDQDFMTFDDGENLDAQFRALASILPIGPVESEFGESEEGSKVPLEEVKEEEKKTSGEPDLKPSRIHIPPHLRYRGQQAVPLERGDRRADVSRGRSPAPRAVATGVDLGGPAAVNRRQPSDRVQNGAGLAASRYGPGPPQPPQNAPTGPRIPNKGTYFSHISPPAPGEIYRTEDLQYNPPNASGHHRAVLILGIPHFFKLFEVLSSISTGEIVSANLTNTGPIMGFQTAYVVFAAEEAAVALAKGAPPLVKNRRLTVSLINTPTWRMSREMQEGVETKGWSRFVRIAERPDDFGPTDLERQLRLMTGEFEKNPALRYWHAAGDLWVEFPGVVEAIAAVEHFEKLFRQVGSVVGFARDPAITDRENAEKWAKEADEENGEVDGYDGDGEETTGQEEVTAGAEERPLIEF